MSLFSLFTFAAAILLLATAPGPGVFATVARALANGFSHAAVLVLGIVLGDLIFLLLAIYGLSSLAEFLGSFFTFVKFAGGFYLIWLGIQIVRSKGTKEQIHKVREPSWSKNFLSGLAITLANPKVIFFYLGFLPTFVDLTKISQVDVLTISLVVILVLGSVLLTYAFLATRTGQFFTNSAAQINLNRCAAAVMISAGVAILLKE